MKKKKRILWVHKITGQNLIEKVIIDGQELIYTNETVYIDQIIGLKSRSNAETDHKITRV